MKPKIVELEQTRVIGMGASFMSFLFAKEPDASAIPGLWQTFLERHTEIQNRIPGTMYGLCESLPQSENPKHGELFYIAAVGVAENTPVPKGMLTRIVPGGRYAVFTHKGLTCSLQDTMKYIYETWLPLGELKSKRQPPIEVYDHRFNPHSENSEMDIYLEIE